MGCSMDKAVCPSGCRVGAGFDAIQARPLWGGGVSHGEEHGQDGVGKNLKCGGNW